MVEPRVLASARSNGATCCGCGYMVMVNDQTGEWHCGCESVEAERLAKRRESDVPAVATIAAILTAAYVDRNYPMSYAIADAREFVDAARDTPYPAPPSPAVGDGKEEG